MNPIPPELDPLSAYLEPRFGDIYEEWTPELRTAITRYLADELDEASYAALTAELFNGESGPEGRQDQVDYAVSKLTPQDIVNAVHLSTLKAVPRLQDLIRILLVNGISNGYEEVSDWLYYRASYDERAALYRYFDPSVVTPPHNSDWWLFEFGGWLYREAGSLDRILQGWIVATETTEPTANPSAVRKWAKEHGRQVGRRGRISEILIRDYPAEQ